ncbi:tonsoku-like protein isoform X2 [Coccinella septempunctata]|uniref:tonsoku-like protein isoform X2 n=1 Tax=Coccinella septempunctata TaxID=41139 RepID=UPI001D07A011|nr:tonsoku-like protein isoform X2 [Coccinella septempunctata]
MEKQKLLKKKRKAIEDKNEAGLCSACTDLANFYMKEERFNEAIKEFEILGQVYKKQKKMLDYATVNRGIGEAYMLMTNYEKAIEYQKIYLGLSKDQENKLEEQRALATLGYTYLTKYIADKQNKNDLIMAHKYTMKSLEVCESLIDLKKYDLVDMTARLYNNLGIIHEYQGHHDKSKELFNKAIVLCKTNDVYESLHQAYNSFASLLERRGEYNSAIQNFNLAIETAKKLKDKVSALYDCLVSKATILLKLGDLQAAKKSLHKAYKLKLSAKTKEEVGKKLKTVVKLYRKEKEMVSNSYSNVELQKFYEKMGDGFSEMNCYDKALEYYHKMLELAEITKTNLSSCYYSIAATYRDDEQYDKAVEFFEKEYALCDFKKGLDTLCEIADTKESGGSPSSEIIKVYERAIQRCKEANSQREEGRMLGRLISYLERSGISERLNEFKRRFDESGFESSDSEDPLTNQESNSEGDISLDNLTDDSENSETESPSKKRRNKTFQVKRNLRGETQLHTACISGKLNVVSHLLEQGHPVNIRDNGGWLPLHDACISGHYDVVELLLDKGASVNDRGGTHCNGTTPLHDAAVNGHLKIMELLLDRGASALAKTDEGETPYHYLKKSSLELQFDEEQKTMCERLLKRMSTILDKAGQSKEINTNIRNKAFVSGQTEPRRRSAPDVIEDRDSVRERRSSNSRRRIESSSSEDEIVFSPAKRTQPKTPATNEYKMVMDSLRKKPCDVPSFSKTENITSKRSAYVMDEENRDEDWLEDDMKDMRTNKKRKMGFSDALISSSKTRGDGQPLKRFNSFESVSSKSSKSSNRSMAKSPDKRKRLSSNEANRSERADEISRNVEDFNEQTVFDTHVIDYDSENDFAEPQDTRRKQQSSLLDAGFMRSRTSSELPKRKGSLSQKRSLQPKITHFGSTTPTKMSQRSSHRTSTSPKNWTQPSPSKSLLMDDDPMLALDVNIEGRSFRVTTRMSMKDTLTVKWLALEASRRYAKKEYVEPVLELKTKSGAELVDDDTIGTLFITDCQVVEVVAKVLKWNLPPIQERYKEACSDMNTKPLDVICSKLDTLTISLDMKNAGLHPASMAPLCKSLLRESRLLELDLSNNFLSLDCVKLLAASLQTLENLTKMNLSCTNLHTEEIRYLSNTFSNSPVNILTKMYSLNLSENFIGDESFQDIATITRHLSLKELDLSFLNFTEDVFKKSYNRNSSLSLANIEQLNLSGNGFGNAAFSEILSQVNGNRLSSLDVGNNKATEGLATLLIDCLNKSASRFNFECLNLSWCPVTDTEVFSLLRYCDNLKTLNLSYTNITSLTLRRILETKFVKNVILLGCPHIDKYFEDIDDLWTLNDYFNERKTIKITCDQDKFTTLIKLWKAKYCDKVTIDTIGNLLILK